MFLGMSVLVKKKQDKVFTLFSALDSVSQHHRYFIMLNKSISSCYWRWHYTCTIMDILRTAGTFLSWFFSTTSLGWSCRGGGGGCCCWSLTHWIIEDYSASTENNEASSWSQLVYCQRPSVCIFAHFEPVQRADRSQFIIQNLGSLLNPKKIRDAKNHLFCVWRWKKINKWQNLYFEQFFCDQKVWAPLKWP